MELSNANLDSKISDAQNRLDLVSKIRTEAKLTSFFTGCAELDEKVLSAMSSVSRHEFVSTWDNKLAYYDMPLPIGYGQTISQPFIVALMTDLLNINGDSVVLEIGTGSGFQTAVLAELARQVYSVEIIKPLASQAEKRLSQLGYTNVRVKYGDGYSGWQKYAPYDGIMVTAAVADIPPALIEQLKPGGRLVLPLGTKEHGQDLVLVRKAESGEITTKSILPVAFVPFTRNKTLADDTVN